MRYKLLKLIEPKEKSISIGSTFDSMWGFVHLYNWLQLSVELLIDQGFIEEVKETPKPRWKVGDYVVSDYWDDKKYLKISEISTDKNLIINYNRYFVEYILRDPTPEELSIYFR